MKFAFISRHAPTEGQHALAAERGITLTHIGDADAFTVSPGCVYVAGLDGGPFDGVIVVHPAAAMRLAPTFLVGVFENANRAPVGEKPQFEAVSLQVYDLRD